MQQNQKYLRYYTLFSTLSKPAPTLPTIQLSTPVKRPMRKIGGAPL